MWDDSRKIYSYIRLSQEDGDVECGSDSESCSISSQRSCIRQFLAARKSLMTATPERIWNDRECSGCYSW